jgi:3-oxoacyl-[acyl-carrier protein] reductase
MTHEAQRKKRPVLVTGASRGIGRAIAIRLGAAGYPITVHYGSRRADADAVRAQIVALGGTADVIGFDISDRATARSALEDAIKQDAYWGVVLSAGIARDKPFPAIEEDDWDAVLRTNLDGFYNVLQPLVMPMIRRHDGGRIVALSSVSGLIGNRGQVNYSASKAGIIGATKALAIELAKRDITVNAVAPGIIETDMTSDVPAEAKALIPMRRFGTVEEVAGLVEFLFTDDAAYITRQVISVNGGLC